MAKISSNLIKGILLGVIVIVILFTVLQDTASDVNEAAGNVSESLNSTNECDTSGGCYADETYPLMSFFQKKGVLLLAFIAGVIIVLIIAMLRRASKPFFLFFLIWQGKRKGKLLCLILIMLKRESILKRRGGKDKMAFKSDRQRKAVMAKLKYRNLKKAKYDTDVIDYNALAKKGIHFCASCGKRMPHHYSGHCLACRKKGLD